MNSPSALIAGEPHATLATPSLVWKPEPVTARAALAELFPCAQPFEVEVGSGDGSFLIQYAKAHPERNFLGIERLLGRLRKTDRKGLRAGLTNLRVLRLEAAYSVEFLLPPAAAAAVHVYFPDPWPKRRHRPRRLVNEAFVASAVRALQPGGHLYLRTDDADYHAQMREVCAACPALQPAEPPAELAAFITDFERHFLAAGQTTHRLAYARKAKESGSLLGPTALISSA